jgi:hypothetical protein
MFWPPLSPDITPLDLCLFGMWKTRGTDLQAQITAAIAVVTARLARVGQCAKLQMALNFKCVKDSFDE